MILHSSASVLPVTCLFLSKDIKCFEDEIVGFTLSSDSVFVYWQFVQAAVLAEVYRASTEMEGQSSCA